jgi:hypothetical protein
VIPDEFLELLIGDPAAMQSLVFQNRKNNVATTIGGSHMATEQSPIFTQDEDLTRGYNGVAASRESAMHDKVTGKTQMRRNKVLALLAANPFGLTVDEMLAQDPTLGRHRSQLSGTVSRMHEIELLACLTRKRNGAHLYVLPVHVGTQTTRAFKPNANRKAPDGLVQISDDARKMLERDGLALKTGASIHGAPDEIAQQAALYGTAIYGTPDEVPVAPPRPRMKHDDKVLLGRVKQGMASNSGNVLRMQRDTVARLVALIERLDG